MIVKQQLLFALPASLGGLVALVVGVTVLWPQWQQVEVGRSRMAELRELEAQLPLMATQLQQEQQGIATAQSQQTMVLELIAGSGTLATFMAQVDKLAALSGVKLSLYEPLATAAPSPDAEAGGQPAKPAGRDAPPPPPPDPLLAPGVAKQEVLLSATGRYPALLALMRQLESLSVLVVQSKLQLTVEEQKSQTAPAKGPVAAPPVQLKMSVATYYRGPQ